MSRWRGARRREHRENGSRTSRCGAPLPRRPAPARTIVTAAAPARASRVVSVQHERAVARQRRADRLGRPFGLAVHIAATQEANRSTGGTGIPAPPGPNAAGERVFQRLVERRHDAIHHVASGRTARAPAVEYGGALRGVASVCQPTVMCSRMSPAPPAPRPGCVTDRTGPTSRRLMACSFQQGATRGLVGAGEDGFE